MLKSVRQLRGPNPVFPVTAIAIALTIFLLGCGRSGDANVSRGSEPAATPSAAEPTVELTPSQLATIKIQAPETYQFYVEKKGVGNIDFDNKLYFDNNLSVQVFPRRPGKITKTLAELGDEVEKGQALFTISGSDEPVRSPITGQVTSVNASPGLEVESGRAPAPYAVADVSTKWMIGNVAESDGSFFQIGQPVEVRVAAHPDRTFEGKITKIYPSVDGNTHRVMIRSEIADRQNELRSGMLAEFAVRVPERSEAAAIPASGVVREADGTMTVWVTSDRNHFSQRVIKVGLREDDRVEVREGLQPGELVVSEGAIFLSNLLQAPPSD
jgi:multidrug efflux pump subunit AcrA (membrane-fusion protein)